MKEPRPLPWQCPLCGKPLAGEMTLKCAAGHSFDRAKEGYWHLLPVQKMRIRPAGTSAAAPSAGCRLR